MVVSEPQAYKDFVKKGIKTFLLCELWTMYNKERIHLKHEDFLNLGQFGIGMRYKCVCVASRAIKIPAISLWTSASGYRDNESIWVSISYNFQLASGAFLANRDDGHESGVSINLWWGLNDIWRTPGSTWGTARWRWPGPWWRGWSPQFDPSGWTLFWLVCPPGGKTGIN